MFAINHIRSGSVLAIGAHPDDIELGCGATLSRHAAEGSHVVAAIMSAGHIGNKGSYNRCHETRQALTHLGVSSVACFDYPDTRLGQYAQELITSIESVLRHHIPVTAPLFRVYTMYSNDRHQDHRAVYDATMVACRTVRQVLSYETPSAWSSFMPHFFCEVSPFHLEKKIQALQEHHSQQHRSYMQPVQVQAVARFRGQQSGCTFSEAFAVHRMVV